MVTIHPIPENTAIICSSKEEAAALLHANSWNYSSGFLRFTGYPVSIWVNSTAADGWDAIQGYGSDYCDHSLPFSALCQQEQSPLAAALQLLGNGNYTAASFDELAAYRALGTVEELAARVDVVYCGNCGRYTPHTDLSTCRKKPNRQCEFYGERDETNFCRYGKRREHHE